MTKTISFNCKMCDRYMCIRKDSLHFRELYPDKHICGKCAFRLTQSSLLFKNLPKKIHRQVCKTWQVPFKYLLNIEGKSTKVWVVGLCKICKNHFKSRIDKITGRIYFKNEPICKKCLPGLVSRSEEHRKKNSQIQKIVQNKPERLKINSETSKKLWATGKFGIKCLRGFSNHNKRMQNDLKYANEHKRRSKFISGFILINGNNIRFDSAYELIFLWFIKDKVTKIRRCNFAIAYKSHFYHPDFFIITPHKKKIVEIKGYYQNNVIEKQKAAEMYIKETGVADLYELYNTQRLVDEGILHGIGSAKMWKQIKEINSHGIITFSEEKHKRIAEIGRRRFFKENKNQENNKTKV